MDFEQIYPKVVDCTYKLHLVDQIKKNKLPDSAYQAYTEVFDSMKVSDTIPLQDRIKYTKEIIEHGKFNIPKEKREEATRFFYKKRIDMDLIDAIKDTDLKKVAKEKSKKFEEFFRRAKKTKLIGKKKRLEEGLAFYENDLKDYLNNMSELCKKEFEHQPIKDLLSKKWMSHGYYLHHGISIFNDIIEHAKSIEIIIDSFQNEKKKIIKSEEPDYDSLADVIEE